MIKTTLEVLESIRKEGKMESKMNLLDKINRDIFGKQLIAYPFNGLQLRKYRDDLGVTQKSFARMCGWSLKKQKQLENPRKEMRHCSAFNRDKIVTTLLFLTTYEEISEGGENHGT